METNIPVIPNSSSKGWRRLWRQTFLTHTRRKPRASPICTAAEGGKRVGTRQRRLGFDTVCWEISRLHCVSGKPAAETENWGKSLNQTDDAEPRTSKTVKQELFFHSNVFFSRQPWLLSVILWLPVLGFFLLSDHFSSHLRSFMLA